MNGSMKYLFGPIRSRRLGISLGVDIIPYKTCTLNCVYCECGKTTNLTGKINEYVPADDVIKELTAFLSKRPELDNITFAGSGEPTLNPGIEKIISFLKKNYPEYYVTVLTNGTLFHLKKIRKAVLGADIIIPSFDAVSRNAFEMINRPVKGITPEKMLKGLIKLGEEYSGRIFLEIFIVPGLNDSQEEIARLREACLKIKPDGIQLNTLDRPGTEKWVRPASKESLNIIKRRLAPFLVDIAGELKYHKDFSGAGMKDIENSIIATLSRRPSTLEDLADALGADLTVVAGIIKNLSNKNVITQIISSKGKFFSIKRSGV